MNITAVESTTLAALAHDEAREILQLEFRSRAIYRYFGVPAPVYEALLAAPSKGTYFNRAIRGNFRYSRATNTRAGLQGEDRDLLRSTPWRRAIGGTSLSQFLACAAAPGAPDWAIHAATATAHFSAGSQAHHQ